jgi:tetratricopeptide (TPR) repeat protein
VDGGKRRCSIDGARAVRHTNALARPMEDQLTAHLDRGWDLAQKGDASGATACAKRALEIDPQSPEVHNLMGFAAALDGEAEEALEHYRLAIALDETYFEAMLNAAEVLIAPLGDFDGAVTQIEEALDYAETDEEIADCILLKVDALMAKGDYEEAKRAMKMLPDGPFSGPSYLFLIGRAWYELGQIDKAAPLIEQAAKADPQSADAHYYLGLVRDEQGDARGATEALLRSRAIDATRPPPGWAPTPETFAAVVKAGIEKLDLVLARYVREAEVYVVDLPGAELVVDGVDPRALLVLDTPPTDDGAPARVRIFVYQRNVERAAGGVEQMDTELAAALEREVTAVFLEGQKPDKNQLN